MTQLARLALLRGARRPGAVEATPGGIVAMAIWFGLATGLLELAILVFRRVVLDRAAPIADLTGHAADSPFPGRSLAASWSPSTADAGPSPDPILTEIVDREPNAPPNWIPPRSLVLDEYLYIRNADGSEELYDLDVDLKETRDLALDPASSSLLERFRARLGPS